MDRLSSFPAAPPAILPLVILPTVVPNEAEGSLVGNDTAALLKRLFPIPDKEHERTNTLSAAIPRHRAGANVSIADSHSRENERTRANCPGSFVVYFGEVRVLRGR